MGSVVSEGPVAPGSEPFGLHGKVALVTGGSRGLGRAMVLAFAGAGADVVVVSRTLRSCEEVGAEVESTYGRRAIPLACDVSCWDSIDQLVEMAYERAGTIDVLVNNAGMSPVYDNVVGIDEESFDSVIALNLKGPFRLTALVGSRMASGAGGSIINISSVGAVRPAPGIIPYAAAKAGVNNMTVGFALTFGPTVRVNCIMPGAFMTDMMKDWDTPEVRRAADRFALQRRGEPDEIIGAALYFASGASSYATGSVLRLDGGIPR